MHELSAVSGCAWSLRLRQSHQEPILHDSANVGVPPQKGRECHEMVSIIYLTHSVTATLLISLSAWYYRGANWRAQNQIQKKIENKETAIFRMQFCLGFFNLSAKRLILTGSLIEDWLDPDMPPGICNHSVAPAHPVAQLPAGVISK